MLSNSFSSYLSFLREMTKTLEKMTRIEQEKAEAVRQDDLERLNACMKQEQAIGLALRGHDQKREALLAELGMQGVPLSGLAARAPEELRDEARSVAETLRQQYQILQGAVEVARNTLECNLHQIEKIIVENGGEASEVSGYQETGPDLPEPMRTDFRA